MLCIGDPGFFQNNKGSFIQWTLFVAKIQRVVSSDPEYVKKFFTRDWSRLPFFWILKLEVSNKGSLEFCKSYSTLRTAFSDLASSLQRFCQYVDYGSRPSKLTWLWRVHSIIFRDMLMGDNVMHQLK